MTMGRAFSDDLRCRILEAYAQGGVSLRMRSWDLRARLSIVVLKVSAPVPESITPGASPSRRDAAITVSVIDTEDQIQKLIPHLDLMITGGLVASSKVTVIRYSQLKQEAK
jgi:Uncharacterized ACR, COG1993